MRPDRYDLGQDRAVPAIPIEANLSRRISGETVSKAALKSRRTSMVESPESAANSRSLVTQDKSSLSSMVRTEIRLKLFIQIIIRKMFMNLN